MHPSPQACHYTFLQCPLSSSTAFKTCCNMSWTTKNQGTRNNELIAPAQVMDPESITNYGTVWPANKIAFTSKQISRKVKLKLYRTIVRPVVTYACETWTLKYRIEQKLMLFKRKILRKISGPIKVSEDKWRIKTNDELDTLINHANIVRYIKVQRISWLGHIERMPHTGPWKR
jgi:hypothetical protein